jgi:hypothetical protein
MPNDTTSQTALIVLAVAASIQTLVLGAVAVAAVLAWRRLQQEADRRYRDLVIRIDEAVRPLRQAAESVQRTSDRASAAMEQADRLAGSARVWLGIPRSLVTVGLTSLASIVLGRWRRHGNAAAGQAAVAPRARTVH